MRTFSRPGWHLDVDVGHALRLRLEDHRVDQPHQRVVALLDRRLVVVDAVRVRLAAAPAWPAACSASLGSKSIGRRRRRAGVAGGRRADLLVGACRWRSASTPARASTGTTLHCAANSISSTAVAARRVFQRHHQPAVAHHQRQRRQPRGHGVGQARSGLGLDRELRPRRPAGSPSCAPARSAGRRARRTPLRTSSSPSGTLRSLRCCSSASSSCASVMKPSAVSASPMRTIGMLRLLLDGRRSAPRA